MHSRIQVFALLAGLCLAGAGGAQQVAQVVDLNGTVLGPLVGEITPAVGRAIFDCGPLCTTPLSYFNCSDGAQVVAHYSAFVWYASGDCTGQGYFRPSDVFTDSGMFQASGCCATGTCQEL